MKLRQLLIALLGSMLLILGCEDDNTDDAVTDDLILIGTGEDKGLTLDFYAQQDLKVGLNKLYFELKNASESLVSEATITQKPIMYMESMRHSCPVTGPDAQANEDGLFTSEVVFIMASGMMGQWDDTVRVTNEDQVHTFVFESLEVRETNMKKNLVFEDVDSNRVIYIVTLNGLEDPEVGVNDITVTVHQKVSMMSFPEVPGLSITLDPQMPDMGHGSNGNIDPVYTASGKYEGAVAFSMTGYWTLDIGFELDGVDLGSIQYEFNF